MSVMLVPETEVTLNIYDLSAASANANANANNTNNNPNNQNENSTESSNGIMSMSSFWTQRVLPSIGMGAYHTSLSIGTKTYTFAAQSGITTQNTSTVHVHVSLPLIQSISLGTITTSPTASQYSQSGAVVINPILNQLRQFFTPASYHLVSRNCNHFTEVLAIALLHPNPCNRYPAYINRLAKTSFSFFSKKESGGDNSIPQPCNVALEAQYAIRAFESNQIQPGSVLLMKNKGKAKATSRSQKKQLTEKQKAVLAKLKARS